MRVATSRRNTFSFAAYCLWRIYAGLCVLLVTCAGLYVCWTANYYFFRYVEFPNGARLVPVSWNLYGSKEYALKDKSGALLVPADIGDIALDGEYVFGISFRDKPHSKKGFIYKKGWPKAQIYKSHSEYQKALEENNLSETFEIPPSVLEKGAYKACKNRIKLQCEFEALDKYRGLLETGQIDAYKRKPDDEGIPSSMSRYKNFLDWVDEPQYRRKPFD